MHEDSQVVAIDAERLANLILVSLLEKQPLQQLFLFLRQRREDFADDGAFLVDGNRFLSAGVGVANLRTGVLAQRIDPRIGPIQLEQDVVADRIHEAAEATG
jgi:hypothetical protein